MFCSAASPIYDAEIISTYHGWVWSTSSQLSGPQPKPERTMMIFYAILHSITEPSILCSSRDYYVILDPHHRTRLQIKLTIIGTTSMEFQKNVCISAVACPGSPFFQWFLLMIPLAEVCVGITQMRQKSISRFLTPRITLSIALLLFLFSFFLGLGAPDGYLVHCHHHTHSRSWVICEYRVTQRSS